MSASLSRHVSALLLLAAALACGPAQAQALRPLPPEFVAILGETDASIAQMSGTLKRIKGAGLNYSLFSGGKVEETLGRMEETLARLQGQVGELREGVADEPAQFQEHHGQFRA